MARIPNDKALALALTAVACGGTTPEAQTASSAPPSEPEAQPTSTAWLYVTGDVRGGRSNECAAVLEAVRAESECNRGLCKYAEDLAEDWIAVCEKTQPSAKAEVDGLLAQFAKVSEETEHPCEVEARSLIRQGCPDESTCAETGQAWATRCGGEFGTPLIARMIAVRIERTTGERMALDVRSCDALLGEIDEGLTCQDVVQCERLEEPTNTYLERCVREDGRLPMDGAVRVLAARAALRQPIEPLPLSDTLLESPGNVLPLASGRGAVVRVGWTSPTTYEGYLAALDTFERQDIMVARVFADDAGVSTLRLGRFSLDDGETLATRFPSLTVEGEDDHQEIELLGVVHQKLARAAQASSNQEAMAALVNTLIEASPYLSSSEALRGEFTKLDRRLAPVFEWVGREKGEKLSAIWERPVLIPALRRARTLLVADVAEDGSVSIGELTPAAAIELRALMPESAAAYDQGLAYVETSLRKTTLTVEQERELTAGVTGQVDRCKDALDQLENAEKTLFACSFASSSECSDEGADGTVAKLGQTTESLMQARLNAKVAVSMLDESKREATSKALRERCLRN